MGMRLRHYHAWVMLPWIPNYQITNSLDLTQQIQENLHLLHKVQVVEKCEYFISKT